MVPTQYEFDGYNNETIGHNVQALHDATPGCCKMPIQLGQTRTQDLALAFP